MILKRGWRFSGFLFLLVLSFTLRLIHINQGLWYDEILTLTNFVHLPWLKIATSLPLPNNHILYSLLAKLSITFFGEEEWSLRFPALIMGGLSPAIFYLVLREKFGGFNAFFAGLFFALGFWPVWFSQDARGYSGQILFSFLSQIFFLRWLEDGKRRSLFYYFLFSMLACYFHLYSLFIIFGDIVYGFFQWVMRRERSGFLAFIVPVICAVLCGFLYIPGAVELFRYIGGEGRDIGGRWLDINFLKEMLRLFSGSRIVWLGILVCAFSIPGFYRLYKIMPWLFWLYLIPAIFIFIFTLVMRVFIYARFLSYLLPIFYLGLAMGIEQIGEIFFRKAMGIWGSILKISLGIIFCVLSGISLVNYYQYGKEGLKNACEYIDGHYVLADVISLGLARNEFRYYCEYAVPVFGQVFLKPEEVMGKIVVASHPWSWAPWNKVMLDKFCQLERVWESAGYDENEVVIYNCIGGGKD